MENTGLVTQSARPLSLSQSQEILVDSTNGASSKVVAFEKGQMPASEKGKSGRLVTFLKQQNVIPTVPEKGSVAGATIRSGGTNMLEGSALIGAGLLGIGLVALGAIKVIGGLFIGGGKLAGKAGLALFKGTVFVVKGIGMGIAVVGIGIASGVMSIGQAFIKLMCKIGNFFYYQFSVEKKFVDEALKLDSFGALQHQGQHNFRIAFKLIRGNLELSEEDAEKEFQKASANSMKEYLKNNTQISAFAENVVAKIKPASKEDMEARLGEVIALIKKELPEASSIQVIAKKELPEASSMQVIAEAILRDAFEAVKGAKLEAFKTAQSNLVQAETKPLLKVEGAAPNTGASGSSSVVLGEDEEEEELDTSKRPVSTSSTVAAASTPLDNKT
jgi:hypothetical protein